MTMKNNLTAGKGETFNRQWQYLDKNNNAIDLSGDVVTLKVVTRNTGAAVANVVAEADAEGNISVLVTKEVTANWPSRLAYRIVRADSDGNEKWIVYGALTVIDGDDV